MTSTDHTREVTSLIRKLKAQYAAALVEPAPVPAAPAPALDPGEPLLAEFLRSFLIWEATSAKAVAALKRIEEAVVDFNELRICLPDELGRIMGERYPRVEERSLRLRAALNELYHREHAVTLEPLAAMSKREAKDYLDSLDGVPRFVASRVFLTRLGGHAAPIDGRIAKRLIEAGIIDAAASPESAAAIIERSVRAGDMCDFYRLVQAWADDAPLNYSDTPVELPRRRETRPAAVNHADAPRKRPARAAREPTKKKSAN